MLPQDIIIKPVITEKSMLGVASKKYAFKVAKTAGKIEIAKAIEAVFPNVQVQKVTTLHVRGKLRRRGRSQGYTPSWKKAYVQLTSDSKSIEIFEGMV
jgi:large subunit ribosomal protein L23